MDEHLQPLEGERMMVNEEPEDYTLMEREWASDDEECPYWTGEDCGCSEGCIIDTIADDDWCGRW